MKKFIKNNIIGFILGAIIFTGVGIYAEAKISADKIEYNDTTVDQALDDLYTTSNRFNSINISFTSTSYCVAQIWSSEQGRYIDAALDTEYQIKSSTDGYKFTLIRTLTRSSDGNLSSCKANITLYNK